MARAGSEAVALPERDQTWPSDAVATVHGLLERLADVNRENEQLRTALTSRIVIEQAKGVLAERYVLLPDQAFEAMRRAARSGGRRLHDVAHEVVNEPRTPPDVAREIQQPPEGR